MKKRIIISEAETEALIIAAKPDSPARLAFGPGWVAVNIDFPERGPGPDRWALEILAEMRGVS